MEPVGLMSSEDLLVKCVIPPETGEVTTDLIAGGGNPESAITVGKVYISNNGTEITVRYEITEAPWVITETHLHAAATVDGIPQTKKGNPVIGQFEYGEEFEFPYVTEWTEIVPIPAGAVDTVYIAAHAAVEILGGLEGLEAALPDAVTIVVQNPGSAYPPPSYFDVTVSGGTVLDGTYNSYCIDTDHTITPGALYTASVFSSYETLPSGLVEFPENLDLVNWIINQDYVGRPAACGGNFTYGDLQVAIWALVDGGFSSSGLGPWLQCRVDQILAEAELYGDGFVPVCGNSVAVILVPTNGSQIVFAQVIFADVDVPCEAVEETAWADTEGVEFADDRNWAIYYPYTL
jgi:hypothetical protein